MGDFARHSPHHLRKFAHSGPTRPLHDGKWCLDTLLPHAETGSEASVWMPARVAVAPTRAVATSTESNSRGDRPHRGRDPGSPSSPTPRPVSGAHAAVGGGCGDNGTSDRYSSPQTTFSSHNDFALHPRSVWQRGHRHTAIALAEFKKPSIRARHFTVPMLHRGHERKP